MYNHFVEQKNFVDATNESDESSGNTKEYTSVQSFSVRQFEIRDI